MTQSPALKESAHPFDRGTFGPLLLTLGLCLLGNVGARLLARELGAPPLLRTALALGTALPVGWAALRLHRLLRNGLDEMLRRILMEGMAFAFCTYLPLAALYLNLRVAGLMTLQVDPPELLLAPVLLLAWGIARAWRQVR